MEVVRADLADGIDHSSTPTRRCGGGSRSAHSAASHTDGLALPIIQRVMGDKVPLARHM